SRQDPLFGQAGQCQIVSNFAANPRKHASEEDHPSEFGLLAHRPVSRMITILLAALRIPPGSLQMAVGMAAAPNVFPFGSNQQRPDAKKNRRIANQASVRIVVAESLPEMSSRNARSLIRYKRQTSI